MTRVDDNWLEGYKLGFKNGLDVGRRTPPRAWIVLVAALVVVVVLAGILAAPADARPYDCYYTPIFHCR